MDFSDPRSSAPGFHTSAASRFVGQKPKDWRSGGAKNCPVYWMIRFSYSKSVCCLLHLLQEEILPKSSREFNHVFTIQDQVVLPRRMVFRNFVILPLRRSGLSYLSVRKDNLKLDALDAFEVRESSGSKIVKVMCCRWQCGCWWYLVTQCHWQGINRASLCSPTLQRRRTDSKFCRRNRDWLVVNPLKNMCPLASTSINIRGGCRKNAKQW